MIEDMEASGKLKPGGTIVEPTSGNTGIALAFAAAAKGYKAVLVMPEQMSIERRKMMKLLGAELVLSDAAGGIPAAMAKAAEICASTPGAVQAGQFSNPANPAIHYKTTGPEIWNDCAGKVDGFIAGVGHGRHTDRRWAVPEREKLRLPDHCGGADRKPDDVKRRKRPA